MDYARKNLANELSTILGNARKEYAACEERDRMEQAQNGADNIRGGFVYDHNRANAESVISGARNMALYAIDRQIKNAESKLTDAPTAEEASYILSISGRTDYTQQEMDAALSRYKSHGAQKAIYNAAKASNLVSFSHMTEEERDLSDLRDLRADVDRTYSPSNFESMSDGRASITTAGYSSFARGGSPTNAMDVFSAM